MVPLQDPSPCWQDTCGTAGHKLEACDAVQRVAEGEATVFVGCHLHSARLSTGQLTSSELSDPNLSSRLQSLTIRVSGGVFARFWRLSCDVVTRATATLSLSLGGLGLRRAERTKVAACWASWADVLPLIQARHPTVAALMVQHLEGESWSPSMQAAIWVATQLEGNESVAVPQLSDLAGGLRPEQREPEDHEPVFRAGWQHCLFPHMSPSERALVRSKSGPGAGVALMTSPSSPLARIESPLFQVLLQRRLRLQTHPRVWPLRGAEKPEGGSPPTCSCATRICGCPGQATAGVWRLLWTVSFSFAVPR